MTFAENNMDIEDLHVTWFDDIVRMVPEKDFEYNKQEVYEVLGHVFHTHSHIEVFCSTGEVINIYFRDTTITLQKGECIFIAPHVYHRTDVTDINRKKRCLIINFIIKNNGYKVQDPMYLIIKKYLIDQPFYKPSDIPLLYDAVKRYDSYMHSQHDWLSGSCIHEILLILKNHFRGSEPDLRHFLCDDSLSRFEKIENVLMVLFMYPIDVGCISESLNISTRQLERIIREQYGCSFHEKITQMRIEAARSMLIKNDTKIDEISKKVGYRSYKAFFNNFMRITGYTPVEYRNIFRIPSKVEN
jgi:AraC-like DNA-binding protein